MARHVVATVDDIPAGQRMLVKVGGREIGIFNIGGEFFAVSNRCPHEGASLCKGRIVGLVESSEPGSYQFSRRGELLRVHGLLCARFDRTDRAGRTFARQVSPGEMRECQGRECQGDEKH